MRSYSKALEGWRISNTLLVASSLFTIIGFCAICFSVMADSRRGAQDLAEQGIQNLASTIESDVARNIEVYDLSLRAVVTNLALPEIKSVDRSLRNLILFDHAASARHFSALQVFDGLGNLTIDAASLDPTDMSVENEAFFRIHRESADVGLFISKPMLHRGAPSIVLSRRRVDQNGQFAGIVAGAIRFSYFHDLISRLALGPNDSIAILRRDGVVVMRHPFDPAYIGRDVSQGEGVARILAEPSGSMSGISALDGISRLFAWTGGDRPLIVVTGRPWSSIYGLWNRQALWISGAMLILVAFVLFNAVLLAREIARRGRAEIQLEELAVTDGLTGLSNRRKFDSDLDLEWRRAERTHQPLSLLMIDADNFKAYNDHFGHQAGDVALKAIAACITQSSKSPGDCAARYGGEEFALLLPGAPAAAASRIAELLRGSIARLPPDPAPITVSVGVATFEPHQTGSSAELIELADKALYEAKRSGRNRCRSAAASSGEVAA